MPYRKGPRNFQAGEDLEQYRQVKIESGTTTDPPEVVYADAGELGIGMTEHQALDGEQVTVKLWNDSGSFSVMSIIASAIARGTTLYSAADGKLTDTASGSAVAISNQAPAVDNQVIEVLPYGVKSTTAGTVSVADSGSIITGATVEAALAEAFTHIQSAQFFLSIPLTSLRELTTGAIPNAAGNGGILASDTTPILNSTNGDTDGALRLSWAASDSDAIGFQTPLPPNLDVTSDLVIHIRAAMESTTDTPTLASDAYFNEADTKVEDVSAAITGTAYAEYTITIAAADIPAGAQTLSVEITPGAHTTDALYATALWIEYTGITLTS